MYDPIVLLYVRSSFTTWVTGCFVSDVVNCLFSSWGVGWTLKPEFALIKSYQCRSFWNFWKLNKLTSKIWHDSWKLTSSHWVIQSSSQTQTSGKDACFRPYLELAAGIPGIHTWQSGFLTKQEVCRLNPVPSKFCGTFIYLWKDSNEVKGTLIRAFQKSHQY